MTKLWKDIKIGDFFSCGSKVISKHDIYQEECYKVEYSKKKNIFSIERKTIVLSKTHLLFCCIKDLNEECKKWVIDNFNNYKIPTLYDRHVYFDDNDKSKAKSDVPVEWDVNILDKNECLYLPISALFLLINTKKQIITCNGYSLDNINFFGIKDVFCVETDTHHFELNGLIHHNSVTLRNIIFHCLTHGEQIAIALVDLKYTEFTAYKGMKNVVAVANTVREAVEILRIGKEVMYKRNQEMAELGINDIKDFKPQKPTNEVMIFNRKFTDDDIVEIKTPNGEIKKVTVKELEQIIQSV